MTDASTPWIGYVRAAAKQVGGVAELARRLQVADSTIHRWISGRVPANSITVGVVTAVANAIGDEPSNALLAAGHLPPPATTQPRHDGDEDTSLPTRIRHIREEMEQVSGLGLPPHVESETLDQLWQLLHDEIRRYQRGPAAPAEPARDADKDQQGLRSA